MELEERDGVVYLQNAYYLEQAHEEIVGTSNQVYEDGPFLLGMDSRIRPWVFRIFFDCEQYQQLTDTSVEGGFVGLMLTMELKVDQKRIPPSQFSESALGYMAEYEGESGHTAYMIGKSLIESGDYIEGAVTTFPFFAYNAVWMGIPVSTNFFYEKGANNGCFLSLGGPAEGISRFASAFFPVWLEYPAPIHKELINYVKENALLPFDSCPVPQGDEESLVELLLERWQSAQPISGADFSWIQEGEGTLLFCWQDEEGYPYYLFAVNEYTDEKKVVGLVLYSIERETVEFLLDRQKIAFVERLRDFFPEYFKEEPQPDDKGLLRIFQKFREFSMDFRAIAVCVCDEDVNPLAECRWSLSRKLENGDPAGETEFVFGGSNPYYGDIPDAVRRYQDADLQDNAERTEQWFDTHMRM